MPGSRNWELDPQLGRGTLRKRRGELIQFQEREICRDDCWQGKHWETVAYLRVPGGPAERSRNPNVGECFKVKKTSLVESGKWYVPDSGKVKHWIAADYLAKTGGSNWSLSTGGWLQLDEKWVCLPGEWELRLCPAGSWRACPTHNLDSEEEQTPVHNN